MFFMPWVRFGKAHGTESVPWLPRRMCSTATVKFRHAPRDLLGPGRFHVRLRGRFEGLDEQASQRRSIPLRQLARLPKQFLQITAHD